MSLADSGDTVGANLSLTDSGEQGNQSQSNTCTQNGSSLNGSHARSKDAENSLEHKVACKTVQALSTGKSGQHKEVTESTVVLLQRTDSRITGNCHTVGTTDTRQTNHHCNANIGNQ